MDAINKWGGLTLTHNLLVLKTLWNIHPWSKVISTNALLISVMYDNNNNNTTTNNNNYHQDSGYLTWAHWRRKKKRGGKPAFGLMNYGLNPRDHQCCICGHCMSKLHIYGCCTLKPHMVPVINYVNKTSSSCYTEIPPGKKKKKPASWNFQWM